MHFPGLVLVNSWDLVARFVLQHSEVAISCGQSHPLELQQTRLALSVFRSAGTNHQAGDQIYHALSDGLLAW